MKHILIIGGTGMLAGASEYFAADNHVTLISRRAEQSALAQLANVHAISVDYRDEPLLFEQLKKAQDAQGPFDYVIAWIHEENAPHLPYNLAALCNDNEHSCNYYHLKGSAAADPSKDTTANDRFHSLSRIQYREIILGFVADGNSSRWLTHKEISDGVIEAVQQENDRKIVGTVEPWSMRP